MDIKPNQFECSVNECSKTIHSKGMCQSHYRKSRRAGIGQDKTCTWDGCDSPMYCKEMCAAHYQWSRVNGKFATGECSIESCSTHQYAKGYCPSHYWILSNYKLEPELYQEMISNQGGLCAICLQPGKLVVDHNHSTKNVRELLCNNCNTALGLLKENKTIANNLIKYLEKHS